MLYDQFYIFSIKKIFDFFKIFCYNIYKGYENNHKNSNEIFEKEIDKMNTFMNGLVNANNFGLTENGAVKHNTTKSAVLDMFALCGSYRNRSDADCILAFKNAIEENETLALKCLFYLRDIRGGKLFA